MPMPDSVSEQSFCRFRELVLENPDLQAQLRNLPDMQTFSTAAVEIGRRLGCEFTSDDIRAAAQAAHRRWLERWL